MIQSMTGYAAATRELPIASLAAELKSVNGRFLDIQFRLPDELRAAEPALRELIQTHVGRGKLECRVAVTPPTRAAPQLAVNESLLAALAEASRRVRAAIPDAQPLRVGEALHWPGVLGDDRSAALREACVALVGELLEEFAATRSREGEKLRRMLIERLDRMASLLASIQPSLPQAIAAFQEKLAARLREALGGTDEERIRQEIALFGVRADVAEELNRLGAHLEEVHGNRYGTSQKWIAEARAKGLDIMLEIDWQGARQVRRAFPEAVGIFIMPPSAQELERRLRARGQDSEAAIRTRLVNARIEISHAGEFDYVIINKDFEEARRDLAALVRAARLRFPRQSAQHPEI